MNHVGSNIRSFIDGEQGATMVEYSLMVAFIALACFLAVAALGTTLNSFFGATATQFAGF